MKIKRGDICKRLSVCMGWSDYRANGTYYYLTSSSSEIILIILVLITKF